MDYQPLSVPGAGVEPARIAPLVFETSASTDSAIRACIVGAKLAIVFDISKQRACFSLFSAAFSLLFTALT